MLADLAGLPADVDDDAVEVNDRPDGLQASGTPEGNLAAEVGGDLGDERRRDFDAVEFLHHVLDVARGEALGVQREDLVVETAEAALVLGDELRLEGALAIARDVEADLTEFALNGLGG